jgi:hypothetical protein
MNIMFTDYAPNPTTHNAIADLTGLSEFNSSVSPVTYGSDVDLAIAHLEADMFLKGLYPEDTLVGEATNANTIDRLVSEIEFSQALTETDYAFPAVLVDSANPKIEYFPRIDESEHDLLPVIDDHKIVTPIEVAEQVQINNPEPEVQVENTLLTTSPDYVLEPEVRPGPDGKGKWKFLFRRMVNLATLREHPEWLEQLYPGEAFPVPRVKVAVPEDAVRSRTELAPVQQRPVASKPAKKRTVEAHVPPESRLQKMRRIGRGIRAYVSYPDFEYTSYKSVRGGDLFGDDQNTNKVFN